MRQPIRMLTKYKLVNPKLMIVLVLIICPLINSGDACGQSGKNLVKSLKILHIMSYHTPWKWTDDQFRAFKYALRDLDVEYRVFQMDTKRHSSEQWKRTVGKQARDLIDSWKPDLVYTNDDNAQEYVSKYYINSDIPFVFSGVNADPGSYGFTGSKNITGVIEQEHFVGTVQLLRKIVPDVRKIAVIIDDGSTWSGVVKRMKKSLHQIPEIQIVDLQVIKTFEEFKNKMKALQTEVDAIALLGIFTYKDQFGNNVPYTQVLKWTAENSNLPDFSFWKDRISYGTLCTVTVSGYEQGLAAGKIARGILVEGRAPSFYPMKPTVRGEPVISLARAKKLGIKVRTSLLLSIDVIEMFQWEK